MGRAVSSVRLERLVHTEEVGGSNPPSPTTLPVLRRWIPLHTGINMPRWRNGRRAAFRAQCPYGCVGSNPSLGTIQVFDLDFVAKIPDVRVPQLHFADILPTFFLVTPLP